MATTAEKGTIGNPYTMTEYEELSEHSQWTGGYVMDDDGSTVYMMSDLLVTGYSGSGSHGSGSFFEFEGYGSHTGNRGEGSDNGSETGNGTGGNNGESGGYAGGGGGAGSTGTLTSKKVRAYDLIARFRNSSTPTVYPNINKESFATALKNQIDNPRLVDQGNNGTCGIAVICKYLAEVFPHKYVEAAISLYKYGAYNDWGIQVSSDSLTGTDAQAQQLDATSLDCIIQGAFRNTFNDFPITGYNPFTDGSGWSSITWPSEITTFIRTKLNKQVSLNASVSYENLTNLDYQNNFVIGLVFIESYPGADEEDSNGFYFGSISHETGHYVQLYGINDDQSISFWQLGKNKLYVSQTHNVYMTITIQK